MVSSTAPTEQSNTASRTFSSIGVMARSSPAQEMPYHDKWQGPIAGLGNLLRKATSQRVMIKRKTAGRVHPALITRRRVNNGDGP